MTRVLSEWLNSRALLVLPVPHRLAALPVEGRHLPAFAFGLLSLPLPSTWDSREGFLVAATLRVGQLLQGALWAPSLAPSF